MGDAQIVLVSENHHFGGMSVGSLILPAGCSESFTGSTRYKRLSMKLALRAPLIAMTLYLLLGVPSAQAHHRPWQITVTDASNAGNVYVSRTMISVGGYRRSIPVAWVNTDWNGRFEVRASQVAHGYPISRAAFPIVSSSGWSLASPRIDIEPEFQNTVAFNKDAQAISRVYEVYAYQPAGSYVRATARRFAVKVDTAGPTGQWLDVSLDASSRPLIRIHTGTDALSGLDPAGTILRRRSGSWNGSECIYSGTWQMIGVTGIRGELVDTTVAEGSCHQYGLQVQDKVSNMSWFQSPIMFRVAGRLEGRLDYPSGLTTSAAVPVSFEADASQIVSARLLRQRADLVQGECQSWVAWQQVASSAAWRDTLTSSGCYRYEAIVEWANGSQGSYPSDAITRVDLSDPDGTLAYPSGYYSHLTMPLTITSSDPQSGLAVQEIELRTASYQLGQCLDWMPWYAIETDSATRSIETSEHWNTCHEYRMHLKNGAGAERYVYSSLGMAWVAPEDLTPPAAFSAWISTGQSMPATTNGSALPSCTQIRAVKGEAVQVGWMMTSDNESGVASYEVTVDGLTLGSASSDQWTWNASGKLPVGPHQVLVHARSWAGTWAIASQLDQVMVDYDQPVHSSSYDPASRTLSWLASDDGCVAFAIIYVDGIKQAIISPSAGVYRIPFSMVGSHTLRVDILDSAMRRSTGQPITAVL